MSMRINLSCLLSMELCVPRPLPCMPSRFFFFIVTACYASLLPYSVCFDAQYEYCQNTGRKCGGMNITYPFGVGNRGCGLSASTQIECVHNSSPVIEIDRRNYIIRKIEYDINRFVIFRNESCHFSDDPINIGSNSADTVFRIANKANWTLNVVNCNKYVQDTQKGQINQCNATVYYYSSSIDTPGRFSIPGCSMRTILVEVGNMNWVTDDTKRGESCKSCEASGGICGYNISDSTAAAPFVCYCKDGPRRDKCPGHA